MPARRWMVGFGIVALSSGLLAACGSSTGSSLPAGPAAKATCQRVGAVLSDGPDPGADPVGYAFAQILPLRQITKTSDAPLQRAIDNLASAYQWFTKENGAGGTVKQAVTKAATRINTLCPGAGAAL